MGNNKTYNPMNKEFQEEAKRLGLTGNQLVQKYKKEGKHLHKGKKKIKTCCNCGSHNTYIGSYEYWYRHNCKKMICTGYLCNDCFNKYDPKSQRNILKTVANYRTDNQNLNSSQTKGDNFEELTAIWKGVKILSKENDNYNGPLDHSFDSEGKRLQTKGRSYDPKRGRWLFGSLVRELNKEFDYEILYCTDEHGTHVERIYIFPKEEIIERKNIGIYKDPKRGLNSIIPWYDQYRIKDCNIINKVNDIWNTIK